MLSAAALFGKGTDASKTRIDVSGRAGDRSSAFGLFENLPVGQETFTQRGVGHVLNSCFLLDREHGGGRGGLAEDHENGFHADGAEGDMGTGNTNRDEEILALRFFRQQRTE